jgi:hypothetical protein
MKYHLQPAGRSPSAEAAPSLHEYCGYIRPIKQETTAVNSERPGSHDPPLVVGRHRSGPDLDCFNCKCGVQETAASLPEGYSRKLVNPQGYRFAISSPLVCFLPLSVWLARCNTTCVRTIQWKRNHGKVNLSRSFCCGDRLNISASLDERDVFGAQQQAPIESLSIPMYVDLLDKPAVAQSTCNANSSGD